MLKLTEHTKPRPNMQPWEWAVVIALDLVLSGLTLFLALCLGGR